MRLCVVGTGYVGLVAGASLADLGHIVVGLDANHAKIAQLRAGVVPIFEPGLADVVQRTERAGRLSWTTNPAEAIAPAELVFVCVGTPPRDDGSPNTDAVDAVADTIANHLSQGARVVVKSSVPVGTGDRLRQRITAACGFPVDVVSHPEFLAEGSAMADFNRPDRVVVGYNAPESGVAMDRLYAPLVRTGNPILHMNNSSAELAKYAANAMLATRVSFMNEMAGLCERLGADVEAVRGVMGADSRIGSRYLFAGCGYGGSCLSKDAHALMWHGREAGASLEVLTAAERANQHQLGVLARKLESRWGARWSGRRVGLWGLAFKPGTDDVRNAPALRFALDAVQRGAEVRAYDPVATEAARAVIGEVVTFEREAAAAVEGADALVVATEWVEFRSPDWTDVGARMRHRIVVDGRNLYAPSTLVAAGFVYLGIGRPTIEP